MKTTLINKYTYSKQGYITLISVLLAGAISLSITVSLLLLGLSSSRTSFAEEQGEKAFHLANACVEEALVQIRGNVSFVGTNNINFPTGDCTYTVTNTGGTTRAIASSASLGTIVRKIQITIDALNPQINIASWQEVADF